MDDYDEDMEFDSEDLDSDDDFDDELDDELEELDDEEEALDDDEVALNASLDGQFDAEYNGYPYGSYGMSVDEDKLTDEQKELYETEYLAGYQDQENQDD